MTTDAVACARHPSRPLIAVHFCVLQLDARLALKLGAVKRFNQPLPSPPTSPTKSSIRSFQSSVFGALGQQAGAAQHALGSVQQGWPLPSRRLPCMLPSATLPPRLAGLCADPYSESEAPKKWVQPLNSKKHWAITSDGLR